MDLTVQKQDSNAPKARRRILARRTFNGMILLFLLWLAASGALFAVMRQPPATFGRVMSHVPDAAFLVFPFETMWTRARAGQLRTGDVAPDFSLLKLDKSETIRLATLASQKPVVLVFGSYT